MMGATQGQISSSFPPLFLLTPPLQGSRIHRLGTVGWGRDENGQCARRHVLWDVCARGARGTTCYSPSDEHSSPRSVTRGVISATPVTSLGLSFPLHRAEAVTSMVFIALPLWGLCENGLSNGSGMSPGQPVATHMSLNTRVSPELRAG